METDIQYGHRDKNGEILKIGDTLLSKKGIAYKLENIGGITMGVEYINGRRAKTTVLRKLETEKMEKI